MNIFVGLDSDLLPALDLLIYQLDNILKVLISCIDNNKLFRVYKPKCVCAIGPGVFAL